MYIIEGGLKSGDIGKGLSGVKLYYWIMEFVVKV